MKPKNQSIVPSRPVPREPTTRALLPHPSRRARFDRTGRADAADARGRLQAPQARVTRVWTARSISGPLLHSVNQSHPVLDTRQENDDSCRRVRPVIPTTMCDNRVSHSFQSHRSAYFQGAPVTQQGTFVLFAYTFRRLMTKRSVYSGGDRQRTVRCVLIILLTKDVLLTDSTLSKIASSVTIARPSQLPTQPRWSTRQAMTGASSLWKRPTLLTCSLTRYPFRFPAAYTPLPSETSCFASSRAPMHSSAAETRAASWT